VTPCFMTPCFNPLANGEHELLADVAGFTGGFYEWLDDAKGFFRGGRLLRWKQFEGEPFDCWVSRATWIDHPF
jgi:hypothetical protein